MSQVEDGVVVSATPTFRRTMSGSFIIIDAHQTQYLDQIRKLWREYEKTFCGKTPCFEAFDQELASLPGVYGPPSGCLLMALVDGKPGGCVGLKPRGDLTCEMKRLYVSPNFRGKRVGRELAHRFLNRAVQLGYTKVYLETIPSLMLEAIALYRSLGFRAVTFDQEKYDQILHMEYVLPVSRR